MKAVKPVKPVMKKMYRTGRFTITTNNKFAIRPEDGTIEEDGTENDPEEQTSSPYLYIKKGLVLVDSSPLAKLKAMGLIIESNTEFTKTNYTAYQFHRELLDTINYDKNGIALSRTKKPRYEDRPDPKIYNENDCLKFGEAMAIAMRSGNMDYVVRHLRTDITKPELCVTTHDRQQLLFGDKENININLYKKVSGIDNEAIPNPGEAYAIVRRKVLDDRAPYHIAFVLYQDNGINITLEAEAGGGEGNPDGAYLPRFAFYDTNPMGYTFHKRWAGQLPGDTADRIDLLYSNGNTIVLGPSTPEHSVGPSTPEHSVGTKRKRGGNKSKRKTTSRKHNKTIKSK